MPMASTLASIEKARPVPAPPTGTSVAMRSYIIGIGARRGGPSLFSAHFSRKHAAERAAIVRGERPRVVVARQHLAAMEVQRFARGHQVRLLVVLATSSSSEKRLRPPAASIRAAAKAAARSTRRRREAGRRGDSVSAPAAASGVSGVVASLGSAGGGESLGNTELGLISRFLEAKMRAGESSTGEELTFNEWVLSRMQAWCRMLPWRAYLRVLKRPIFGAAARSIQGAWRKKRRAAAAEAAHSPEAVVAARLQRAWRRFTNRQIFRYFRDMILFHEQGDAAQLLKSINPREARLMDIAAGIHVRFRLGGVTFPPTVYYKVYTHAPVSDIGAFAPRDYTAHKQAPAIVLHNHAKPGRQRPPQGHSGWYRRVENNGWRPVVAKAWRDIDPVATATAARPVVWHHSKLKRRDELARQRKQKKVAWMQKMYEQARAEQRGEQEAEGGGEGGDFEDDDVDALLRWSDALDFDAYHQDWLSAATSARPTWREPVVPDLEYEGVE